MSKFAPLVKFNNGRQCPILGLGTWKSKPGEVTQAVKTAIDVGYRHIDCAFIYGNEKEVGDAIEAKIKDGTIKREDIFITSKLWNTFHRPDLVETAIKKSLENLKVDYLDLYLIHWPLGYKEDGELFPQDKDGKMQYSEVDYVDTWKEMEKLVEKNLTKSIGVSNFNSKQLERLLQTTKITPVVNQIECHPYLNQKKLINFCQLKGIAITAYSPFASPDRPWATPNDPKLFEDARLKQIADKHKKTIGQVALRYNIQRGNITIPKSVTESRIKENFNIFDFTLTPEDISTIDGLNTNARMCPMTASTTHKYWPFGEEF